MSVARAPSRRIARSHDRRLAGVAGGLAEHVGWEPWRVRALWLIGIVLSSGVRIAAYVVLAVLMPPPPAARPDARDIATGAATRVVWSFLVAAAVVAVGSPIAAAV